MTAALLYPFIIVAGALQALGNSMNAQLRGHLVNPFLAASVSFLPIVFVFATLFLVMPTPLPGLDSLAAMPWYAPLGGVAGAVAVFGGLAFVDKVGAGPFNGLTLTANILTSLALDSFGLFGLPAAGFKPLPWLGGLLMAVGVTFIARVTPDKGTDSGGTDAGHGLNPRLLYPFIVVAGALQAIGVVWNAQLRGALVNPWLAAWSRSCRWCSCSCWSSCCARGRCRSGPTSRGCAGGCRWPASPARSRCSRACSSWTRSARAPSTAC